MTEIGGSDMPSCSLCGSSSFHAVEVLWPELIDEWGLRPDEVEYVNRQQGKTCRCGASLRIVALGDAIRNALGSDLMLQDLVEQPWAQSLRVLDLNGAAALSPVLARLPGYVRGDYPDVDMLALPFGSDTFDLVVHSDTLEHVPSPLTALAECRRVLTASGRLCFTIPIIVGRMTRDRVGLPKSYHGYPTDRSDDYLVQSEFGADAWTFIFRAGFRHLAINAVEYPAAHAITAWTEGHLSPASDARLQALDASIESLRRSRSWRMTEPLRQAVQAARRVWRS